MFARWLNILLGLWLIIAPVTLVYGLDPLPRNIDLWCGIAVAAFAVLAGGIPRLRYANTAIGVFLVVAPFLLGYWRARAPLGNDVIVGLAVVALSLIPSRLEVARRRVPGPGAEPPSELTTSSESY